MDLRRKFYKGTLYSHILTRYKNNQKNLSGSSLPRELPLLNDMAT
jgi:hypothetical protein